MKRKNPNPASIFEIDRLMPEDFLFLLLRLINYPGKPSPTIVVEQIKQIRFKQVDWKNCAKFLNVLALDIGLQPALINKIALSEQAVVKIEKAIENYLEKFVSGTLIPIDKNYFAFKKQKQYFLELIQKKLNDGASKEFLLADSEVEHGYRMFETTLLLERQKYLKIENIYNCRNPKDPEYFKIALSVNPRKFQLNHNEEKTQSTYMQPFCIEESGAGYLKLYRTGKKIKIGRSASLPYRMLHRLTDPFGVARSIDAVFEFLYKTREVGDRYLEKSERINKIVYVKKELQKIPEFRDNLEVSIDTIGKKVWLQKKP